MKENGEIIKLMDKESSIMLMVIYSKVNGLMIKLMDMVFISISMVPNMKVHGLMICNMDMESKLGPINPNMKAIINEERNMVAASISGLMDQHTMENGMKIK